jgi:hypothetical protein
MKDEYDFSNAQRGKFYKPDLRLIPPVRLDPQVLDFLVKRAEAKGITLNALLNALLKRQSGCRQRSSGTVPGSPASCRPR